MKLATLAGAIVLAATSVWAQEPRVVNASIEQRAVSGRLESLFDSLVGEQTKAAWIGYAVPAVPRGPWRVQAFERRDFLPPRDLFVEFR